MKKELNKIAHSAYEVKLTTEQSDHEKARKEVLKHFQKDLELPGFRKGFVPMDMVQEHINQEYLVV
jgi:FKBP-type peptidyl-prolyl cis-trans isomerase (trigger factor)